jgi:hypothetical protein
MRRIENVEEEEEQLLFVYVRSEGKETKISNATLFYPL